MNIIVTGGAGFIGSHLVDRLIQLGHTVLVIDNLVSGCREFINDRATFEKIDIRDTHLVHIFKEFQPEYVFHEAAQTMVDVSMEQPAYDCDVNLMGLLNILEACRICKVKKILMPSSAAVYGDNSELPLCETSVGIPSSFYGLSKLTSESYLRLYYESFGLPYICYRYSNVYGPRQGNGGEGGVVSIFGQRVVKETPITVLGDGEQTRDFIYVGDVVEANIAGLQHPEKVGIYNVSTNSSLSVNQLIDAFKSVANRSIEVIYAAPRQGDIRHSRLDNHKIQRELNFTPHMSFIDGLTSTYDYFKSVNK